MSVEFRLPDVGEGLSEAELLSWHVVVGQMVEEDAPLADIQTDKAIVELTCPTTGVVIELRGEPGDTIAVGSVFAVFKPSSNSGADRPTVSAPVPHPGAQSGGSGNSADVAGTDGGTITRPLQAAGAATESTGAGEVARPRVLASPAVRRLARERGIDLATVRGSGDRGRVVVQDLEQSEPVPRVKPASGDSSVVAALSPRPGETIALRGLRRTIANTLTLAWQTIPHVIDYREVDMTVLMASRALLRQQAADRGESELARALTLTPFLLKIACQSLQHHPIVNASIDVDDDAIKLHQHYHLGIATSTPAGLVVPVVRDVDRKSVFDLALEAAELCEAARLQRASRDQLTGATFTVNNYGGLGIWLGTPIIKPPEAANLGFGRVQERPVILNGEVVARPIAAIACSGDHRILDGDTLAAFVSDLVTLIEAPSLLLGELR